MLLIGWSPRTDNVRLRFFRYSKILKRYAVRREDTLQKSVYLLRHFMSRVLWNTRYLQESVLQALRVQNLALSVGVGTLDALGYSILCIS